MSTDWRFLVCWSRDSLRSLFNFFIFWCCWISKQRRVFSGTVLLSPTGLGLQVKSVKLPHGRENPVSLQEAAYPPGCYKWESLILARTVMSLLYLGTKEVREEWAIGPNFLLSPHGTKGEIRDVWLHPSLNICSLTPQKVSYQVDPGHITTMTNMERKDCGDWKASSNVGARQRAPRDGWAVI